MFFLKKHMYKGLKNKTTRKKRRAPGRVGFVPPSCFGLFFFTAGRKGGGGNTCVPILLERLSAPV